MEKIFFWIFFIIFAGIAINRFFPGIFGKIINTITSNTWIARIIYGVAIAILFGAFFKLFGNGWMIVGGIIGFILGVTQLLNKAIKKLFVKIKELLKSIPVWSKLSLFIALAIFVIIVIMAVI